MLDRGGSASAPENQNLSRIIDTIFGNDATEERQHLHRCLPTLQNDQYGYSEELDCGTQLLIL